MAIERFSKVLLVEDNEAERRLLSDILQEEQFEVIACEVAAEALGQVQQHSFGAAIVDLRLPDLSGTQLLERIRALDDEVRVIIYTGAASFDSVKEALNLGAFAYVEKLSDPSELLRYVQRACRERVGRYASDLEGAVAERTAELARSNRELESFASVVAHDLRSPLLTISGYCQILQQDRSLGTSKEAHEYLGYVVDGVTRMNRLIEDLLDYSRVGRSKEPFESVALETVVSQVLANLEAIVQQNRAQVQVGPLPAVHGDQTQLIQLFQNLIGNALKFRGDADPIVAVCAKQIDGDWQFAVKDNGIGIDEDHFEQIFQVFQRLHGQEYPGTGIGLALCKKIVEWHGGRIWLDSQPGHGTTFFFTLPGPTKQKGAKAKDEG